MSKIFEKSIKATIINVIVALFITAFLLISLYLFFRADLNENISIINRVAVEKEERKPVAETIMKENRIENYPEYGAQYATIQIPAIDVDLPVCFGDTLEIIKNAVGHSSGSYFPGEGGSIIYMGHNSQNIFRRFSELVVGDEITVTANYGTFKYKIYDMQLINETDLDKLPIQKEKEILMVYTCYPFKNYGYTTQRYVVYAELQ